MADFDFDLLNELVEHAPTVGFGPQVNFGKMHMEISICSWDRSSGQAKFKERPFTGAEKLKDGEYLRVTFISDMSEMNAALSREYKRRVDIKRSGVKSNGEKNPKALTDWSEIVEPSLKAVLGADWSKKLSKGAYLQWEDVETVQLDKDGNPRSFTTKPEDGSEGKTYVNTAPRFVKLFKSKAECQAAREERFKKSEADEASSDADEVPASVIKDFKGLVESLGLDQAINIVNTSKPFGEYTGEELTKAAGL